MDDPNLCGQQCSDHLFSKLNLQKQFDHVLKMHRGDIIISWSLTLRINGTPVFYAPWPKNYLTRSQSGSNKKFHFGLLFNNVYRRILPYHWANDFSAMLSLALGFYYHKSNNNEYSITTFTKIIRSFYIL